MSQEWKPVYTELNNSSIEMRHIIGPKKPGLPRSKSVCIKPLEKEQQLLLRTFLQTALSIHMPQKVCSWSIFMICFLNKGKIKKLSKFYYTPSTYLNNHDGSLSFNISPPFFSGEEMKLYAILAHLRLTKPSSNGDSTVKLAVHTLHVIGQHL